MEAARAAELSSPTQRIKTNPAPTAASSKMSPSAIQAHRRAAVPLTNRRRVHTQRPSTRRKASPLPSRWTNSMIVSRPGSTGRTEPLHNGQWLPHPAPDPEARTNAPHRMTPKLTARTAQTNRTKPGPGWEPTGRRSPAVTTPPPDAPPGRLPDVWPPGPSRLEFVSDRTSPVQPPALPLPRTFGPRGTAAFLRSPKVRG